MSLAETLLVTGTHGRVLIALLMPGTLVCLYHSDTAYPGSKSWQCQRSSAPLLAVAFEGFTSSDLRSM